MPDSFLTYLHLQDIQCIYFFQDHPAPHPTIPPWPPALLKNGPPGKQWNFPRLIFPLSRMQNVLHVPVTRDISGQMHVFCIRNFFTYAGLMQTGKWPLLKIRGL